MVKRNILFDTTEVVAKVVFILGGEGEPKKKKTEILNITYDQFLKISFEKCTEKKWFKKVESEKIILKLKSRREPVEFTKMQNEDFWEEYKEDFRAFAERNRIELIDKTK